MFHTRIFVCIAVALVVAPAEAARYSITMINPPETFGAIAIDINELGQVALNASFRETNAQRAFLWDSGIASELGTLPGATHSEATAINDRGEIVGRAQNVNQTINRAFLFSNGAMTDLGTFGGLFSEARDINNAGQVVGSATVAGPDIYQYRPFLYDGNQMIELRPEGRTGGSPIGINNKDQILVAYSDDSLVYDNGIWRPVVASGAFRGFQTSINNLGQVTGAAFLEDERYHAVICENGVMTDLNTLLTNGSFDFLIQANKSNDVGQILVMGIDGPRLFENGIFTELESLIPADTGWRSLNPTSINNLGQIVGQGNLGAFLMSPVDLPDPSRPIPGDSYPRDGIVDIQDLNNVRNHFGNGAILGPPVAGDTYPYDGVVDLGDLNRVRNFFGTSSLSAVPEPSTLGIALISSALACLHGLRTRIRAT